MSVYFLRDDKEKKLTLTLSAPARILPHDTASSGRAPESEPSYCVFPISPLSFASKRFTYFLTGVDVHSVIGTISLLYHQQILPCQKKKQLRTNSIAFAIWCLHTPPPRMIIPAFFDLTLISFSRLISATMSMLS